MAKSRDAFRTISEVAEWLDIQAHVLRFWESKFAQVKPVKRAGGRRYYRPQDMLLLGGIKKLLHDDGMTIKGAQKLLREEGVKHVSMLSHSLDEAHGAMAKVAVTPIDQAPDVADDTSTKTDAEVTSTTPLLDVFENASPEPDAVADAAPENTDTVDVNVTPAPEPAPRAPATTTAAEGPESDPDEALEDFLVQMCSATHIHPAQVSEAADLAARLSALFEVPQETVQA